MLAVTLIVLLVLCVLVLVAVFFVWATYNRLILLRNRMKEAWSDIDVLLKRRHDLIPNLVEIVKGYATHEKSTLEAVIKARNMAVLTDNKTVEQQAQSENFLSGTLKSLFAVSENYPELKANVNFLELQKELVDTENKIQASRRFYNTNVLALNTKIELFPSNVIANFFKFEKGQFFNLENKEDKEPVKVKF
ncbi:MAG: LemA family protein [Elusimicrobia bacterium]|nr:LemA family protein [Elusimicrobiota bacterium]